MIGTLNENQIDRLLQNELVGRIGCHADDITYVVPISYAYEGACIYAHTHQGMKVDLMRKNPKVCFEVDDTRDTANWQSVIAWGTFEEIHNADERNKALHILNSRILPLNSTSTTHLGEHWPFSSGESDWIGDIIFRIRLSSKTGRFETSEAIPAFTF